MSVEIGEQSKDAFRDVRENSKEIKKQPKRVSSRQVVTTWAFEEKNYIYWI